MSTIEYTLHHASLVVSDTEKSLHFYRDVLGMQQTARPKLPFPGAWLKIGEQQIHLLELDNPDPTTGRPAHGGRDRHVALTVKDLTPVKEALDKADVTYTLSISGRQALFCRDPDGNAIEVIAEAELANMPGN
ncbi:VOC family protein [Methylomarinum vadi]|uniref:VOC family protein n=1 Tax=Methylomarinum vadi TaxID=438855 RepID=UPI0004DF5279|nr:VOC family protein [Methylomarinum vadi]